MGDSWIYIDSNFPARSISAGCRFRIWAISADEGCAFIKNCTNFEDILSCGWQKVSDPLNLKFVKIVAGFDTVWALDAEKNLYFRTEISDVKPAGLAWVFVCSKVFEISATIEDQIWALLEFEGPTVEKLQKILARRIGANAEKPWGTDWEFGPSGPFMTFDAQSVLP